MSDPGTIQSFLRGLGQGASFGWADELAPMLTPTVNDRTGIPRTYAAGSADADMRANMRGDDAAAMRAHPLAYAGGEMAGQAPASSLIPGATGGRLARFAKGALQAGAQGGLMGAGANNGTAQDRLQAGARAAATAAPFGGAMGAELGRAAAPTAQEATAAYRTMMGPSSETGTMLPPASKSAVFNSPRLAPQKTPGNIVNLEQRMAKKLSEEEAAKTAARAKVRETATYRPPKRDAARAYRETQ